MSSNCYEDTKKELEKNTNPILKANIISKFCFWWTFDLFRQGFNETLKEDHLYEIIPSLDSAKITEDFKDKWNDELSSKKPNVFRLLKNLYGLKYIILSGIYGVIHIGSKVLLPICFAGYVEYFTINQIHITKSTAYFYAFGIILATVLPSVLFHLYAFFCSKLSIKIRIGLSGLIFEKILITSSQNKSSGSIINIMSNDLRKFETALTFAYILFVAPIEALLYIFVLYEEIGVSGIIGILFILFFLPLQSWIAKKSAKFRLDTAKRTDARIKLVNEIIQGIQVIKMYTWEKYFTQSMLKLRKNELEVLKKYFQMFGIARCMYLVSKLAIFISLTIFVINGGMLTARNVFMTSTIFMLMDENIINLLNNALQNFTDALVSIKRVNELLLDNISVEKVSNDETSKLLSECNSNIKYLTDNTTSEKSINLENVTVQWNASTNALKNVFLNISDNLIVAIVGKVGSGKSTLLHALLGEMTIISGNINVQGKFSYAPQESWIFQGTIRDNIVFGEEYNEKRYNEVLKACALEQDLEHLSNGDGTLIGENGISLSGGQKARVNLARTIYKKADIYLLDDPLSAVDAKVSKHIFEKCIVKFLSGKIRVLVTHQLQYLDNVDQIVLMNSGEIEKQGTFNELKEFQDFKYLENEMNDNIEDADTEIISDPENKDKISSKLHKEEQTEGAVKFLVYKSYFESYDNWYYVLAFFFVTIMSTFSIIGLDYFLSKWVSYEESMQKTYDRNVTSIMQESSYTRSNWLLVYIAILFITLILYIARVLGLFKTCLTISLNIYQKMFNAVLNTKMNFFNSNSSGSILNRFSADMGIMDSLIPITLFHSLRFIVDVPLFIFVAVMMNFWILFPAIILGLFFYGIRKIYIKTSRSVQRIDAITQSPVYSLVNQTLQGLLIIRSYQAELKMKKKFHQYQDDNTSAAFLTASTSRAFAFWLELFYVVYTIAVTLSFLIFESHFSSGNVGLVLLQCASIVGMVQFSIRQTAELENQMIRVERIIEYIKIREEGAFESASENIMDNWPTEGNIEFINYSLKYTCNSPNILKNLNIKIRSKEKIGIVGRTGAGKSSMIQAIYRLAYSDGKIEIDGIDISSIGLHDLRCKISIIPQHPVLFSGTIRYNLDPSGQCTDFNLWKSLEDVKLKDHIERFPDGIDGHLSENGANFSVGQKQLVCLARAILRDNKILIMDEATANVDLETDKLIQETIKTKFSDCTVLTIAHRLESVISNDRILVMDNGCVVEFDTPENLLESSNGYFTKLLNEAKMFKKTD